MTERRRAFWELGAMLATGGLQLLFENVLDLKLPYLGVVAVLWAVYLVRRAVRTPGLWRDWGFRLDNLKSSLPFYLGISALIFVSLRIHLAYWGGAPLGKGAGWVFLVYPVWALLQQFALQVMLAGNLRKAGLPEPAVLVTTALLFGVAHLPDLPLAGMTAAAGLLWTWAFHRRPNLWILSFSHAWLGTLAFYWMLGRDPWLEMAPQQRP